ncbi:hypothetical protein BB561_005225 [Smittium simulii]|uniref:Mannose-P-dolichol utilization defect 1 protein homolog n=1 Tax=Smittium simulii TaxID=133385 RepID=A0A2T9YBG6_9FUNG|nr:hypothetical protein BB561_005225 [Smittium simulii]
MLWLYNVFRTPVVWIIGEKCTIILLDHFNLLHSECLKYAIIKCLGFGLVLGGSIVKIPQIYKILKQKSAFGLSMSSVILECLSNIITFMYNISNHNPFSTFGESFFIGIQNFYIIAIIHSINKTTPKSTLVGLGCFCVFISNRYTCPYSLLTILQLFSVPLMISSRLSQIYINNKFKTTGQLAAFTVFANFAGTFARVLTTIAEIDDSLLLFTNIINASVNGILAYQMIIYRNSSKKNKLHGINSLAANHIYN